MNPNLEAPRGQGRYVCNLTGCFLALSAWHETCQRGVRAPSWCGGVASSMKSHRLMNGAALFEQNYIWTGLCWSPNSLTKKDHLVPVWQVPCLYMLVPSCTLSSETIVHYEYSSHSLWAISNTTLFCILLYSQPRVDLRIWIDLQWLINIFFWSTVPCELDGQEVQKLLAGQLKDHQFQVQGVQGLSRGQRKTMFPLWQVQCLYPLTPFQIQRKSRIWNFILQDLRIMSYLMLFARFGRSMDRTVKCLKTTDIDDWRTLECDSHLPILASAWNYWLHSFHVVLP